VYEPQPSDRYGITGLVTSFGHIFKVYANRHGFLGRIRHCRYRDTTTPVPYPPLSTSGSPCIHHSTATSGQFPTRDTPACCPTTRLTHCKRKYSVYKANYASHCAYWPAFSQAAPRWGRPSTQTITPCIRPPRYSHNPLSCGPVAPT